MPTPILPLPAKDWYMFPENVPGIYCISDRNTAIYIGEAAKVGWRLAEQLSGWSHSELWYKCALPSQTVAWFQLIERWIISLLAVLDDGNERNRQRANFISTFHPLLNNAGPEHHNVVLERRYRYFQDTGIAGLYHDHAEREAFEAQHPELFRTNA